MSSFFNSTFRARKLWLCFLTLFLSCLASYAAEHRLSFSKSGDLVITGTATVKGNAFSVGISSFVISSGNIGIGTTTPSEKLDVYNGNIQTNYGIKAATTTFNGVGCTWPATRGAANTTLTEDGAGNLAWAAVGAPAGTIIMFASSSCPSGYLKTDGTLYSKTVYASLYNAVGNIYGESGDSFNVPDLRGYFVRAYDDGRGLDSGRGFATVQQDEIKSHRHTARAHIGIGVSGGASVYPMATDSMTENTGDNGGFETRPKNIAMQYCIKY